MPDEHDMQPEHFPMGFDEWAGTLASPWRHLVAAFKHAVRADGRLQHQRLATEWAEDFEAFKNAPVGGGK